MKAEEFRNLDPVDQDIILWEKAIFTVEREDAVYKYILYQLDDFYIEVRVGISDLKAVLKTFTCDKLLKPYLDGMELTEFQEMISL